MAASRFEEVHRHLEANGIKVAKGTIVDATIINAPSSTKNADQARDPDMHQTKKGTQRASKPFAFRHRPAPFALRPTSHQKNSGSRPSHGTP